jgi:hypothetical protein
MKPNEDYLNRVKVFLEQELPQYKGVLTVSGNLLLFTVPVSDTFQPYYESLHAAVTACIARIRNLEYDLDFTVRSANQERDFKVYKPVSVR